MSQIDNEKISSRLLKAIEEIGVEKLKIMSHSECLAGIRRIAEETLSQDGTRLILITQAIKDCQIASYKRDLLVQLLDELMSSDKILTEYLIGDPFGLDNCRRVVWKEHANTLITIPDHVANCQLLNEHKALLPHNFYKRLLECVWSAVRGFPLTKNPISEHQSLLVQLLGRISMSHKDLVWQIFTSKALGLIPDDEKFSQTFRNIFLLPVETSKGNAIFEQFIEYLYLPIFRNLRPTDDSGQKISLLLGTRALENESFRYLLCDKSILRANFNIGKSLKKVILFNVFSYLSYNAKLQAHCDSNILLDTLHAIITSWSSSTRILLRLHEHNEYITWALLVCFRFAIKDHKDKLAHRSKDFQSMIANAIPVYLNRSDSIQRNLGIYIADLLMPDLNNLILHQNSNKKCDNEPKEEIESPMLLKSEEKTLAYSEARELYKEEYSKIFRGFEQQDLAHPPLAESKTKVRAKTEERTNQSKPKEQPTVRKKVEVIDSGDDENSEDSDGNFGEELERVPIYLRDCVEGLRDQSASARYVRLCLVRASQLVDKFSSEQQGLDTITDVGVELAQTVLFAENQFNLKKFNHFRMKILSSLCCAKPELIARYLVEQLNRCNRSMRQQIDILDALVASAQQLSSIRTKQAVGGGKVNRFARYVPLYFYGICHRLKADLCDDSSALITPLPGSVLAAFRDFDDLSSTTSENDAETILTRAINMDKERRQGTKKHGSAIMIGSHVNTMCVTDRVLELETVSDDSYLLSRILNSISVILRCASQQPILCRLSNDLFEVLRAYRCHPDLGVQKSIVSCLKTMQDCTPEVHFKEQLEDKMVRQFGPWLESKSLMQ